LETLTFNKSSVVDKVLFGGVKNVFKFLAYRFLYYLGRDYFSKTEEESLLRKMPKINVYFLKNEIPILLLS
jgi:endo-1,4-beta-D-glucanase Y